MQMVISAIVMVNCGKDGNSVSNIKKKVYAHIIFRAEGRDLKGRDSEIY